jgi:hypothetical protein
VTDWYNRIRIPFNYVIRRGGIRNLTDQERSEFEDLTTQRIYELTYETLRHNLEKVDKLWGAGELHREINSGGTEKINKIPSPLHNFWDIEMNKKEWHENVSKPQSTWDIDVEVV